MHQLHRPLDELLDLYVRDGFVYYKALRSDRGRLDRFVASLSAPGATALAGGIRISKRRFGSTPTTRSCSRRSSITFRFAAERRSIPPSASVRFPVRLKRRSTASRGGTVSLDSIEKEILTPLGDARVFLALGRGAYGGGRLRSEAFDGPMVEQQLSAVAAEAVTREELVKIDSATNVVSLSPIFSWREAAFVASFADKANRVFAARSPLERAVLAIIESHLFGAEEEFLEKNAFKMQFHDFDWRLNDLGARNQ